VVSTQPTTRTKGVKGEGIRKVPHRQGRYGCQTGIFFSSTEMDKYINQLDMEQYKSKGKNMPVKMIKIQTGML
jgi:hypothetical protein